MTVLTRRARLSEFMLAVRVSEFVLRVRYSLLEALRCRGGEEEWGRFGQNGSQERGQRGCMLVCAW